ncbi:MAG TPA: hypothetical protein VGU63_16685, partial [Candidatus Acidoferrales bacterium]|nr:hypothetical protein [Candidatus Acidoferrales bacterium]
MPSAKFERQRARTAKSCGHSFLCGTCVHLPQPALAKKARIGLSTLDALENGRLGELGYSKITNILSALGLELKVEEASARR